MAGKDIGKIFMWIIIALVVFGVMFYPMIGTWFGVSLPALPQLVLTFMIIGIVIALFILMIRKQEAGKTTALLVLLFLGVGGLILFQDKLGVHLFSTTIIEQIEATQLGAIAKDFWWVSWILIGIGVIGLAMKGRYKQIPKLFKK